MRSDGLLAASLFSVCTALQSQTLSPVAEVQSLCFRGRPAAACRSFFITESGGNVLVAPNSLYRQLKAQLEFGLMRNVGPRSALGGTAFVESNLDDETYVGVKPRYRRWISRVVAIDLSAGPRLDTQTGELGAMVQGGVSFADWVSFTSQVELGPNRLNRNPGATLHLGVRFGSYPGAVGIGVAPIVVLLKGFADSFSSGWGWGY